LIEEIRGYFGNISYVFVNQYGEKLKRRKHQKIFKLKDECCVSLTLFKTYIYRNLFEKGDDICSLQMILDHADISTV